MPRGSSYEASTRDVGRLRLSEKVKGLFIKSLHLVKSSCKAGGRKEDEFIHLPGTSQYVLGGLPFGS
jgi:hypothetical protein